MGGSIVLVWEISGYDGTEKIFSTELSRRDISLKKATEILRRLVCQHLTPNEIVSASLHKGNLKSSLLEIIHVNSPQQTPMSCGTNPHYVAKLVRKSIPDVQ